jgi:hypothetical protein
LELRERKRTKNMTPLCAPPHLIRNVHRNVLRLHNLGQRAMYHKPASAAHIPKRRVRRDLRRTIDERCDRALVGGGSLRHDNRARDAPARSLRCRSRLRASVVRVFRSVGATPRTRPREPHCARAKRIRRALGEPVDRDARRGSVRGDGVNRRVVRKGRAVVARLRQRNRLNLVPQQARAAARAVRVIAGG